MPTGRTFRVTGRVQGVGFRWWTARAAKRLGLVGSVQNEADGSVVVVAWGEDLRLDELERLLRAGPVGARVDGVLSQPAPGSAPPTGFTIDH